MNYKIFHALKHLEPQEIASFKSFLTSSYVHSHSASIRTWEYLQSFYPDFDPDAIDLQALHNHTFPEKPFKRQRVLDELSYL